MQIGPFQVLRELGRGGMGAVYLAQAPGAPLPLALKVVHADLAHDPDLAERFRREGLALERLDHPHVVKLRGRGSFEHGLWLAMDYVEGETLAQRLERAGPLSSEAARALALALCDALAHAHLAGILHRDLKPENVLLRAPDDHPLLVDFGLALPLDRSQHLTRTGEILGTPGYLAPEQCGLAQGTSAATDVYGLGALLFGALTGRPPFRGGSLVETLDAVVNRAAPSPSELVPGVDAQLAATCLRCLAKDPSERYPDTLELARALQRSSAPSPSRVGPGPRRALALVLLLLCLGLVGGAGWALRAGPPPTPSAPSAVNPSPPGSHPTTFDDAALRTARARRDWPRAHELLAGVLSEEAAWERFELLRAESDPRLGDPAPGFEERRSAASDLAWRTHARAETEDERDRAQALALLAQGCASPFGRFAQPSLRGAGGPLLSPARRAWPERYHEPLARLDALCLLGQVTAVESYEPAQAKAVLRSHTEVWLRWEELGGAPWELALYRAQLGYFVLSRTLGVRDSLALEALRGLDTLEVTLEALEDPSPSLSAYALLVRAWLLELLTLHPKTSIPLLTSARRLTGASRQVRARAAVEEARLLLLDGEPARALEVLEPARPELDQVDGPGAAWADQLTAEALLELGDRAGAQASLPRGDDLPPTLVQRRALTARELRALTGRPAANSAAPAEAPWRQEVLLLRCLALEGKWEPLQARLSSAHATHRYPVWSQALAAFDRYELLPGQALCLELLRDEFGPALERLLTLGLWRVALRLSERCFAQQDPERMVRASFLCLYAGRREAVDDDLEFRDTFRRERRRLAAALEGSPQATGLLALVDLAAPPLGDPGGALELNRLQTAADRLARAAEAEPSDLDLRLGHALARSRLLNHLRADARPAAAQRLLQDLSAWPSTGPHQHWASILAAKLLPRERMAQALLACAAKAAGTRYTAEAHLELARQVDLTQPAEGAPLLPLLSYWTCDPSLTYRERSQVLEVLATLCYFEQRSERSLAHLQRIAAWSPNPEDRVRARVFRARCFASLERPQRSLREIELGLPEARGALRAELYYFRALALPPGSPAAAAALRQAEETTTACSAWEALAQRKLGDAQDAQEQRARRLARALACKLPDNETLNRLVFGLTSCGVPLAPLLDPLFLRLEAGNLQLQARAIAVRLTHRNPDPLLQGYALQAHFSCLREARSQQSFDSLSVAGSGLIAALRAGPLELARAQEAVIQALRDPQVPSAELEALRARLWRAAEAQVPSADRSRAWLDLYLLERRIRDGDPRETEPARWARLRQAIQAWRERGGAPLAARLWQSRLTALAGDPAGAVQLLRAEPTPLERLEPQHLATMEFELALCLASEHDLEGAARHLSACLKTYELAAPQHVEALFALVACAGSTGREPLARDALEELSSLESSLERAGQLRLWVELSALHGRAGEREAAERALRRARELADGPSSPWLRWAEGAAALQRGDLEQGRALLSALVTESPFATRRRAYQLLRLCGAEAIARSAAARAAEDPRLSPLDRRYFASAR